MWEEIRTTWIIAGLLVAVMGLTSVMADSTDVRADTDFDVAKAASGTIIAKKITEEEGTCGWMGSLFSKT